MRVKYPLPRGGRWDFMRWYDIPYDEMNPREINDVE